VKYSTSIKNLAEKVPPELVNFSLPRDLARTPTQASSNFITNNEQGDWAENLILRAINEASKNHIAIKYGKSDDRVAGDEGFDEFYLNFQDELDTIGKRPDILIFKKSDYKSEFGTDISQKSHNEIADYVKKSIAGIEIRSSAFLIDRYEHYMNEKRVKLKEKALKIKDKILMEYMDVLQQPNRVRYVEVLQELTEDKLSVLDFKVPGWSSSDRLIALNDLLKELKASIKEIQKRDYLSITPKVEDIKVVYKWIETFNVPHFYFQVFFDKVYGIPLSRILEIISNDDNDGVIFSVERDTKNQNKTTIKINSKCGIQIAYKIDEPQHKSVRKEMGRGRLLFYVTFQGGTAYLDIENLMKILKIDKDEF
jgi:type II restriction enzyme